MTDEEREEGSIWDRISKARDIKCRKCGESSPAGSNECQSCHAALKVDEDEEAFSAVAGEERKVHQQLEKIPLEEAKTLIALRKARDEVQAGTINDEGYRIIVMPILNMAQMGVAVFESEPGKKFLAKLEGEEADLAKKQYESFGRFLAGVTTMVQYLQSHDVNHVTEGFAKAEKALEDADRIQDRQIEIAAQFVPEGK
ncbi:MAG: hypothetical protein AB2L14_15510 [Candidatus Xenobiia bacterium LiM19]